MGEEIWDCEVASDGIVMDDWSVSAFVVGAMRYEDLFGVETVTKCSTGGVAGWAW